MHDQRDVAASETSISALPVTTCEAMEIKQGQVSVTILNTSRRPLPPTARTAEMSTNVIEALTMTSPR